MVKEVILGFFIVMALTGTGLVETLLWIVSGFLIYSTCIKIRELKKSKWKKTFFSIVFGYFVGVVLLIFSQYSTEEIYFRNHYTHTEQTAVVLLFDMESPVYMRNIETKNFFQLYSLYRAYELPVYLFRKKIAYEQIGQQRPYYLSQVIEHQLKKELNDEYNIYLAYTYSSPYIEESIQKAVADGNSRIIICNIGFTETPAIQQVYNLIKKINIKNNDIKFKHTSPLWDSELLAYSIVQKIKIAEKPMNRSSGGILLIGEKWNDSISKETYIKQDLLFREKVRDLLIMEGYDPQKIRLAFLDEKSIHREVEKLMEYGVGQIIFIGISNDSNKSEGLLMLEKIINKLEPPMTLDFSTLDVWEFDSNTIQELLKRIELVRLQNWNG